MAIPYHSPEISDRIVAFDGHTLKRRPVAKAVTLIRPLVAIAGVVYGVLSAPRLATILLGAFVLTMMLGLEKALSFFRASDPAK